jgi:hypothetical protein
MAKKTIKQAHRLPKVVTIVACDGATRDPTGKATLYGIFDNVIAINFPATAAFTAYCKLADGRGKFTVSLDVIDSKGKSTIIASPSMEMDCAPGKRNEMVVVGLPIKVTRPGLHQLRAMVDGKPLSTTYEFSVVHNQPATGSNKK